jgi:hypothetical protein
MKTVAKEFNSIKHAVIHNSPKNTAFAMLMERKEITCNYQIAVFSIEVGALNWLNN